MRTWRQAVPLSVFTDNLLATLNTLEYNKTRVGDKSKSRRDGFMVLSFSVKAADRERCRMGTADSERPIYTAKE